MTNLLSKGNITTIATWIAIGITMLLSYFGVEFDLTPLIPIIAGLITLGIAIYSSKHPNTFDFLGNGVGDTPVEVTVDTDAIIQAIQEYIDEYSTESIDNGDEYA